MAQNNPDNIYGFIRVVEDSFGTVPKLERGALFEKAINQVAAEHNQRYRETADYWRRTSRVRTMWLVLLMCVGLGVLLLYFDYPVSGFTIIFGSFILNMAGHDVIGHRHNPVQISEVRVNELSLYLPTELRQKLAKLLVACPQATIQLQVLTGDPNVEQPHVLWITVMLAKKQGGNDQEFLVYLDDVLHKKWSGLEREKEVAKIDAELRNAATG